MKCTRKTSKKNATKKLEVPMEAATHWNLRETKRLESTLPKDHDHIAENGFNSLSHCNLVHKFIPVPQATKIPDAKVAVDKEWEKLEKLPAWQTTKLKSKREGILEAQKEERTVQCYAEEYLSSPECAVGTKVSTIQRPGCTPR